MLPVRFEVVPSAVNSLLPAFLQVLIAAGECLFRNACELHRRSRLNSLDSHVAVLLTFFSVVETEKIARREIRGVRGMWKRSNVVFEFDVNSLFKSDLHSSNSKNRYWQGTRGFPPRPAV
jgi:hypothetical protein